MSFAMPLHVSCSQRASLPLRGRHNTCFQGYNPNKNTLGTFKSAFGKIDFRIFSNPENVFWHLLDLKMCQKWSLFGAVSGRVRALEIIGLCASEACTFDDRSPRLITFEQNRCNLLESRWVGNFLPFIFLKYVGAKRKLGQRCHVQA